MWFSYGLNDRTEFHATQDAKVGFTLLSVNIHLFMKQPMNQMAVGGRGGSRGDEGGSSPGQILNS